MEQLFGFNLILIMTEKIIQKFIVNLYKMYAYINTYLWVYINSKDYIHLHLQESESHTVDILAFSFLFSHFFKTVRIKHATLLILNSKCRS